MTDGSCLRALTWSNARAQAQGPGWLVDELTCDLSKSAPINATSL